MNSIAFICKDMCLSKFGIRDGKGTFFCEEVRSVSLLTNLIFYSHKSLKQSTFLPHPVSDCYDRAAPMWLSVTLVKTRFMYGGFYVAHFCGDIRQSGSRPVVKKGITALPLMYNPSFKIQANKGMVITARHPRLSRRSLRFRQVSLTIRTVIARVVSPSP